MKTLRLAGITLIVPIVAVIIIAIGVLGPKLDIWGLGNLLLIILIGWPLAIASPFCSLVGVLCSIYALRRVTDKTVAKRLLVINTALLIVGSVVAFGCLYMNSYQRIANKRRHEHYLATRTPEQYLFDAIKQKKLEEVKNMLEQGVDSNSTNHLGRRALHHAAMYSTTDVMACLLEQGAVDSPDMPISLHLAAGFGNLDMLKLLVEKGWSPHLQIDYYQNGTSVLPLDVAISASKTGREKKVEIEYLRSLTETDNTGTIWTPETDVLEGSLSRIKWRMSEEDFRQAFTNIPLVEGDWQLTRYSFRKTITMGDANTETVFEFSGVVDTEATNTSAMSSSLIGFQIKHPLKPHPDAAFRRPPQNRHYQYLTMLAQHYKAALDKADVKYDVKTYRVQEYISSKAVTHENGSVVFVFWSNTSDEGVRVKPAQDLITDDLQEERVSAAQATKDWPIPICGNEFDL